VSESSADVIRRYLEEAIAIENGLESQLHGFIGKTHDAPVHKLLEHCAVDAKRHSEKLSEHLDVLGGRNALGSGLLGRLFAVRPKVVHNDSDTDLTPDQQLVIVFAAENGGVAYYEALAGMAAAASDPESETLVRSIQQEKRRATEEIWHLLSNASVQTQSSAPSERP
jgi:hypothetical protein